MFSPDGGMTPFHSEKATGCEGDFRAPYGHGIRLQILFVAWLPNDLKNAMFLGSIYVYAVAVVSRQIVVRDMANFVKR
jgi:hypothetical protein